VAAAKVSACLTSVLNAEISSPTLSKIPIICFVTFVLFPSVAAFLVPIMQLPFRQVPRDVVVSFLSAPLFSSPYLACFHFDSFFAVSWAVPSVRAKNCREKKGKQVFSFLTYFTFSSNIASGSAFVSNFSCWHALFFSRPLTSRPAERPRVRAAPQSPH